MRIGHAPRPHVLPDPIVALFQKHQAQRAWNPHGKIEPNDFVLTPPHGCGGKVGVRLESGAYCRRCGKGL